MDFVALIDLVKTVTKNKVKNIEVLGNPNDTDTMLESFYDAISKGKVKNDREAAKYLYGKQGTPQSPTYLRLKNRLIRQLVNVSLFIDLNQPMFNDRARAYYNCYRDFAAAHILGMRTAGLAAIFLFEQILEQAIKYEFIELVVDVARELRKLYGSVSGNQTKHEQISQLYKEYEEKQRLGRLAAERYETLVNYYIVKRSPNEEVNKMAKAFYQELMSQAQAADTSSYLMHTYNIGIIQYFSDNNATDALRICEECIKVLREKRNTNRSGLALVAVQKMTCLTQLRKFDADCDETFQYSLSLVDEGSLNWFRSHEIYLHYCLFAKRYADALDIYTRIASNEKFGMLSGAIRDNWFMYGGYLHLLAALGKLDPDTVVSAVGDFRFAKMINEIEVLNKDKEGMNIPLVLLPVAYALATGTFEDSGVSPESIEKYRRRYLDTDMNRRSAAFVNLLFAYAKKDYHSAAAEKKIARELEILASVQPQMSEQTFAVEIVPYEDLWAMLLEK